MTPTLRLVLLLLAALLWVGALLLLRVLYRRLQGRLQVLAEALREEKRRARRDITAAEQAREQAVLLELLPVLDNLDRALQAAPTKDGEAVGTWVAGVQLTRRSFLESLARLGVRPIAAAGQPFDPRLHEAAATVEDADLPPGQVVNVLRDGFLLGDRLLRPTLCTVSRAPAPTPPDPAP